MTPEPIVLDYPDLTTDRLLLRKFRPDDRDDIFEWASVEEVAQYTTWSAHQTPADSAAFVERAETRYNAHQEAPWAVTLQENGKVIGMCGLSQLVAAYRRADLYYALHQGFWGKGYAAEAAKAVLAYGFDQLGLNRIEAMCVAENPASERVMQKLGMSYEGTLRDYTFFKGHYDTLKIYAILARDWQAAR